MFTKYHRLPRGTNLPLVDVVSFEDILYAISSDITDREQKIAVFRGYYQSARTGCINDHS